MSKRTIDIRIKRLHMHTEDLRTELKVFKFKLWQHLEERTSSGAHTGYVNFLEWNITDIKEEISKRLTKVAA